MKPGRELDALVAEKVMGWKDIRFGDETSVSGSVGFGLPVSGHPRRAFPPYSTDIAAAWAVVEELELPFEIHSDDWHSRWDARFNLDRGEWCQASTAPHAICLAALKAMGNV